MNEPREHVSTATPSVYVNVEEMGLILKCYRPAPGEAAVIEDFEIDDGEAWHDYALEYSLPDVSKEIVLRWLNDGHRGDRFDLKVQKAESR